MTHFLCSLCGWEWIKKIWHWMKQLSYACLGGSVGRWRWCESLKCEIKPCLCYIFSSNEATLNVPCLVHPFIQNHCNFELFNLLGISCRHVFFIRKSLPLHDEKRKMKSYLWFCGRVMNWSQEYWGSNLVGCIFFSDEERQDWVRTVSKRRRNGIRISFMKKE